MVSVFQTDVQGSIPCSRSSFHSHRPSKRTDLPVKQRWPGAVPGMGANINAYDFIVGILAVPTASCTSLV